MRAEIDKVLGMLRAGHYPWDPPPVAAAPRPEVPEETPEQQHRRVVAAATDDTNVERRRAGLRGILELLRGKGLDPTRPVEVPVEVLGRVHEETEPDAECRAWVMKILGHAGGNGYPHLAIYAAFALYDPQSSVRRTAAEALGEIGTPAGLAYLRSYFLLVPHGPEADADEVREFNSARSALVRLTGHEDVPGGEAEWIGPDRTAEVRQHWAEWFRSADGARALIAAAEDLERIGELFPQRYLVDLVNEPDLGVAKAAYFVLLRRAKGPPQGLTETELEKLMWPRFPRVAEPDVGEATMPGIRDAVTRWWTEYRSMRK
jgi:hypothetical protein